jgi:hypothetical protein
MCSKEDAGAEFFDEFDELEKMKTVFHRLVIDVRVKTFEPYGECNKLINLFCTF